MYMWIVKFYCYISTYCQHENIDQSIKPLMMEALYNFQLSFPAIKYLQNALSSKG